MFRDFNRSDDSVRQAGLGASLQAALAADPLCGGADLSISFLPDAVVIEGRATSEIAIRAKAIVSDIVRPGAVLDRIVWIRLQ